MTYSRPLGGGADASFEGAPVYVRPGGGQADAQFGTSAPAPLQAPCVGFDIFVRAPAWRLHQPNPVASPIRLGLGVSAPLWAVRRVSFPTPVWLGIATQPPAWRLHQPNPVALPVRVGLSLGSPSWTGGYADAPAGARWFWARVLDPVAGVLDVSLSEIQCRRRLGASTWVVARIPSWSPERELFWLSQRGAMLLVMAGDGSRSGEFMRAVLTEVAAIVEPSGASITLTGRVHTPRYTARARRLRAVSGAGVAAHRRRARADVDPLLRPNDLVFDGHEWWVVGAISYRVGAHGGWMDVQEVAS